MLNKVPNCSMAMSNDLFYILIDHLRSDHPLPRTPVHGDQGEFTRPNVISTLLGASVPRGKGLQRQGNLPSQPRSKSCPNRQPPPLSSLIVSPDFRTHSNSGIHKRLVLLCCRIGDLHPCLSFQPLSYKECNYPR